MRTLKVLHSAFLRSIIVFTQSMVQTIESRLKNLSDFEKKKSREIMHCKNTVRKPKQ